MAPRRRSAAVALAFVLPMLWLFSVSLKTKAGVYAFPPQWLPDDASLDNYAFVLGRTEVPWYLLNSFKVALAATAATLVLGVPAAYVLSREDVRGRSPLLTALLALQMVSPIVLLVPIYGLIGRLGLLDTHAGLVVVYAAVQLPFTIVVLKNFFDALPASLLEAARLDGGFASTRALARGPAPGRARAGRHRDLQPSPGTGRSSRWPSCSSIPRGTSRSQLASSASRADTRRNGSWWPRPASSASCP